MIDEGYIKFKVNWTKTVSLSAAEIAELNHWRQKMYDLNLMGAYENGIGFGNISQRIGQSNQFYISGSKTGNFRTLNANHYSKVTQVVIDENTLDCTGASIASSESMSHAVIYEHCAWVNAVIHVHHLELWKKLLYQIPTTEKGVPYGSPEMAHSIIDLLKNTDAQEQKIFVMEGHEEGIFVFGADLEEAAAVIGTYL
ncbi:MAG: class II aldolase/adducin family protein [Bacteroidota bacterium]